MRARCAAIVASLLGLAALVPTTRAQPTGPTLSFGGDVIFDGTTHYALRQMDVAEDDAASYGALFEELELDRADLTIVNLETPIAARVRERTEAQGIPVFAAPRAFLEALADAGVDAVSVANNHAYDQGVNGLAETLAHARSLGVRVLGAGETRATAFAPTILEHAGARIAIVAATEGTNQTLEHDEPEAPRIALLGEELLASSLATARRSADLVVADLHWTSSSTALPTREMRSIVERAANAGADLIVAHGPHVLGPRITVHTDDGRDVPVLVSLGNLAAVMQADDDALYADGPSVRDSVLVNVSTRRSPSGRLEVSAVTPRPFFISASRRALFPGERTQFVRPLSIDRELARAATCGPRCAELSAGYAARRERIASLFAPATTPSTSTSTSPSPSGEPVDLGLAFATGSPRLDHHDHPGVVALAARLRDDHSLFVVVVSHPGPDEDARIADRRAHAARGLLSVLGPSRSRFEVRIGAAEPAPRVEILLQTR